MTTLREYKQKATYRFCLFGRAKVGKSALAAQLARIWKLHWFDLEDGIKTALNPQILAPEYWDNIHLYPIPSHSRIPMAAETLMKVIKGNECLICWKHGKVACPVCKKEKGDVINRICLQEFTVDDCLVIDSTTQLSTDVSFAVNPVIKNANEPSDFVLDKDTGGKDFKYPMAVAFILDRIFGTLQASNVNVVVISHEVMTEQLKDTGKVVKAGENQPAVGGEVVFPAAGSRNFSRNFGRYFDMLIHLDVVNKQHRAFSSTTYSSNVQTGSRLPFNIEDIKGADGKPLPPNEAIVEMIKRAREAK